MVKVFKAISAVLGIFICIALSFMGYAFYTSDEKSQGTDTDNSIRSTNFAPLAPENHQILADHIGEIALGQAKGSTIASVTPQGALLYVIVQGGSQPDRVLIVDLAKRKVTGQIKVGSLSNNESAAD